MQRRLFLIWFIVLLLGISGNGWASHIVGGELTYKCLGNNVYQIQLDIYQDCLSGQPDAIKQDTPAFIGILDLDRSIFVNDSLRPTSRQLVPPNFNNSCVNNPPPTCLWKVSFVKQYRLAPNSRGYRIAYVRCCRNATIGNILFPSETGATYFVDIPPAQPQTLECNNSAVFRNFPPQIICVNNPLVYDHSAFDQDGDSLSYEFCESYEGGSNFNPKPFPELTFPNTVTYAPGYSAGRPIAGNPTLQINAATGMISGTPNQLGRYVVTVCCNEWRNGQIINTIKREFQFVITNCSKAVVANIPQYSEEFNTYIVECKSNTVGFVNLSTGGFAYNWDFGVLGATSTEFQPTYTYPDTGTYIVKLVVNQGSTCPDSISRIVKIYPTFSADYKFDGLPCPNTELQFTDLSEATYKPIIGWYWDFGDKTSSAEQHPKHTYTQGGNYNVIMTSMSERGCRDTAVKTIVIEPFNPFAGNDTIIVKGEVINFNASGGTVYRWTPSDMLNFSEGNNPRGYYPDTGTYRYNVYIRSALGCEGNDSIRVHVVNQATLWLPNAFTPNGDGLNDVFRPRTVGYSQLKKFRVFSRWGEMVFDTNEFGRGWDGGYKGQKADLGTYFWLLDVVNRFGQDEQLKGDVILLR